jgi:phosphatidate cytidylyltransferase
VLTVMMVVWIADIGAYFVGRAFGRRKLAPRVSPGKSWEGALGGLVVVLLVAFTALALIPADSTLAAVFPRWLVERAGLAATVLVLVAMVALSVIGDLHESLLKRARGVKDSGRIFPGHGGVLDRIDALIPTVPLALLVIQGMIGSPE